MELLEKFEPLGYVKYILEKIYKVFAKRISYYFIMKNSEKYIPVTTNAAKSVNSISNIFLSFLSKSSKLVEILKNSRQFFAQSIAHQSDNRKVKFRITNLQLLLKIIFS
jgi:hypothetical protein